MAIGHHTTNAQAYTRLQRVISKTKVVACPCSRFQFIFIVLSSSFCCDAGYVCVRFVFIWSCIESVYSLDIIFVSWSWKLVSIVCRLCILFLLFPFFQLAIHSLSFTACLLFKILPCPDFLFVLYLDIAEHTFAKCHIFPTIVTVVRFYRFFLNIWNDRFRASRTHLCGCTNRRLLFYFIFDFILIFFVCVPCTFLSFFLNIRLLDWLAQQINELSKKSFCVVVILYLFEKVCVPFLIRIERRFYLSWICVLWTFFSFSQFLEMSIWVICVSACWITNHLDKRKVLNNQIQFRVYLRCTPITKWERFIVCLDFIFTTSTFRYAPCSSFWFQYHSFHKIKS